MTLAWSCLPLAAQSSLEPDRGRTLVFERAEGQEPVGRRLALNTRLEDEGTIELRFRPTAYDTELIVIGPLSARLGANGKIQLAVRAAAGLCEERLESVALLPLQERADLAITWGRSATALSSQSCFRPAGAEWAALPPDAGRAAVVVTLPTTLSVSYRGTASLTCPAGGYAVIGSCNTGNDFVLRTAKFEGRWRR